MEHIKFSIDYARAFVSADERSSVQSEVQSAQATLLRQDGKGNDFLGWINLPEEVDSTMLDNIAADVRRLSPMAELFVVVGIGGSYLGARAVIEALQSEFEPFRTDRKAPFVIYAGHTLSEDYYHQLLGLLDQHDYAVAVISKSGTTTEPAVAFRIIKSHLEKKYGDQANSRIIAITDARKGALHDIALQEGYRTYVIPDNVGGRFSVLTPVGLLPIAMSGYDVNLLLQGARDMRKICIENKTLDTNPALMYVAMRNILYRKGRKVEMLVNFVPALKYISEWWKQLYGESEGKEGKGIMPHSLSFTTDLHSMGQYVQEGERMMFETVINVERPASTVDIPADAQNLDGINYLLGKSLTDINHNAELGTIQAHNDGGVPVLRFVLPEINEYYLGQLIYLFEFACGVSGYVLGVNPFDQPGVEAYKKNMFRLLGKPGYGA